jgi:outer membrane protein
LSIIHCQTTTKSNWTLAQCIDYAIVNNFDIRSVELKSDASKVQYNNSKYNYLPNLTGGATHGYNWGQTIDPFTNQFATNRVQYNNFYLGSSLVLFSGLQKYYTHQIYTLDYQSQQLNKTIEIRNLKIKIATAYLQVLLNNEVLLMAKQHLILTTKLKEKIKILVDAEREANYKLLEINSQEQTDKYNILKAQNDFNYSLLLLQQIMNMNYEPNFTIQKLDTITNENEIQEKINISNFPEIKLSDLNIEKQALTIKSNQGRLSPTLTMNGSIGSGYSENNKYLTPNGELQPKPFDKQLNENFYQSASLTLSIPIFNNFQNKTQIQLAQIELERIQLEKEKLKQEITTKIEQIKLNVSNYKAQLTALESVRESNRVNYNNYQIRYENGNITYTDLLEVKDKLFKSQSDYIQTKYQLVANQIIFGFYQQN